MYKFQSNQSNKQRPIDGFFPINKAPKVDMPPPHTTSQLLRHSQPILLDDFKKPDGFSGRKMPNLGPRGDIVNNRPILVNRPIASLPLAKRPVKKRRSLIGKLFLRLALVIVAVVICTAGFLVGKAWWSAHKVLKGGGSALAFNTNIDPHLLNGEGDGRINILLLGQGGSTEQDGGDLTDSMMIASIDPVNMKMTLLSIPRDLWVDPSGYWSMKINAVYESAQMRALAKNPKNQTAANQAGFSEVCNIVQQYLGVHMNYYGMIEFSAFQEAVNTIGGIDITLSQPYSDATMRVGNKPLYLPAGTLHLDGAWALAYARSRHGAARGDFSRGEHQQQVIVGIKNKVMSLGTYSNPVKLSDLMSTFGNRVQTDLSMTDLMRLYSIIKRINNNAISHIDLDQAPDAVVTTGMIGNQSVVYPLAGINDYSAVQAFVRTHLRDGFLAKENASVIVLNGTTQPNLAAQAASTLKSYGYNVISTANAPEQNVMSTIVVDNTKGVDKYTKHYLEQRFKTTAVTSVGNMNLSAYKADFIVIMGSNGS